MASANQSTSNDKVEYEINDSIESKSSSPVPPKRKMKAKDDDATEAAGKILNVESDSQIIADNSRVVFVDEQIVKSEVLIANISDAKDINSVQTNSSQTLNEQNLTQDFNVTAGNTKLKIASLLEKTNEITNSTSPQAKIVICRVNLNNQKSPSQNNQSKVLINPENFSPDKKNASPSEQINDRIKNPVVNENVDTKKIFKDMEIVSVKAKVIESTLNLTDNIINAQQHNDVLITTLVVPEINNTQVSSKTPINNIEPKISTKDTSITKIETKENLIKKPSEIIEIKHDNNSVVSTSSLTTTENIQEMIHHTNQSIHKETTENNTAQQDTIVIKSEEVLEKIQTKINSTNQSSATVVNLETVGVIDKKQNDAVPKPRTVESSEQHISHKNVEVEQDIVVKIEEKQVNCTAEKSNEIIIAKSTSNSVAKSVECFESASKSTDTSKTIQETTTNKFLLGGKPMVMKKPTMIGVDQPKLQKVPSCTKIPVLSHDKAENGQENGKCEIFKAKKYKASLSLDKSATFDGEPKLTKKQRTSSEQCLSLSKSDSEQATSRKLRSTVDLLQHENSTLKKLLESERSAFREHRAVQETEARKEKAEGRRREASLEGQLRAALKGQPGLVKSASAGDSFPDVARLATALENAKTANKSLQEKLQIVTEADKRKAGELRAQHDAHALVIAQMERDSRAQAVKLLEELKSKERHLEQVKKVARGAPPGGERSPGGGSKGPAKMAVADQLHFMEGQISRLEHEIQRRDDIIQTLRSSKVKRDRRLSGHQLMKDNLFKDILSDVDSAVSSAPNSLSPQPSPDLWFHPQDGSHVEMEEGLLEAKKQIQELEKALSLSTATQHSAQLRATQLEEQLQDLREHADLLEFRCLELEDASEKRNSLEELTDSDSGCTSPENRLKNSVSPQLRRSDSGYKSPTRPSSPNMKNQRILMTPTTSYTEYDPMLFLDNHKSLTNSVDSQDIDSIVESENHNEDIRYKLERMLLRTHSNSDRNCLEQVLHLLWNLQALSGSLTDEDYSMIKHKKISHNDFNKNEFDQTKSGKIIATISPYSQKSSNKSSDLIKSVSSKESDLVNILIKEESKKILYGLQESGIFEESDWDSKETQTEWCDCICAEPESDLATEVQRLNQIREQLEKSGAIRSKNLRYKHRGGEIISECSPVDLKQQKKREKKKLELYENRIELLENKISVYESSDEVRQKKLAQRLQREVDLQSKVKNLEFDLSKLKKKYLLLEEERCEFEEAENDTRLHCQELEAEFDILTAKLRDMDDQRSGAANKAECYRELAEEYEYKNMSLQQQDKKWREKMKVMEKTVPALVCYNIFKILEDYSLTDFRDSSNARACRACGQKTNKSKYGRSTLPMIEYEGSSSHTDPFSRIEKQLNSLVGSNEEIQISCKRKEPSNINMGRGKAGRRMRGGSSCSNQSQICNCQEYAKNQIEELLTNEMKMKQRIEELEKRELAFLETLTKGDEMWADMEFSYKQKIKENEENEVHLVKDRNRWKAKSEQLEIKIQEMEENEATHAFDKKKMQEEIRELNKQKEVLSDQVISSQVELLQTKTQMDYNEKEFKKELLSQRKVADNYQDELREQKKTQKEIEDSCACQIASLKKDLSKAHKGFREQEDNVDELVEEVSALEKKLKEMSNVLEKQRAEHEEQSKSLLHEIRSKTIEVENLKVKARTQGLPSAEEELSQIDKSCHPCNCSEGQPKPIVMRAASNCKCPVKSSKMGSNLDRTHLEEQDVSKCPISTSGEKCDFLRSEQKEVKFELPKNDLSAAPVTKINCCLDCMCLQKQDLPMKELYTVYPSTAEDVDTNSQIQGIKPLNIDHKLIKAPEMVVLPSPSFDKSTKPPSQITIKKPIDSESKAKVNLEKLKDDHHKAPIVLNMSSQTSDEKVIHTPQQIKTPEMTQQVKTTDATKQINSPDLMKNPKPDIILMNVEILSDVPKALDEIEKQSQEVMKGKPELPKRKPKLSPRLPPKLKYDDIGKRITRPGSNVRVKKADESKSKNQDLPPPLDFIDRGDICIEDELENNVCKMLNESLDCCLDKYSMTLYNQLLGDVRNLFEMLRELLKKSYVETTLESKIERLYEENKMLQDENLKLSVEANYLKAFIEGSNKSKKNVPLNNQESKKLEENAKVCKLKTSQHDQSERRASSITDNIDKNTSQRDSLTNNYCSKSNGFPSQPFKISPIHVNNNLKRYHSLSESRNEFISDLPLVMSKSDSAVTHNSTSAKELIASFNSMKETTNNSNHETKSSKQSLPNLVHGQPKSVGSLVFDRVTKLTSGLGNAKIQMGLKRSVSMVADSKTAPTKAVFTYADL